MHGVIIQIVAEIVAHDVIVAQPVHARFDVA